MRKVTKSLLTIVISASMVFDSVPTRALAEIEDAASNDELVEEAVLAEDAAGVNMASATDYEEDVASEDVQEASGTDQTEELESTPEALALPASLPHQVRSYVPGGEDDSAALLNAYVERLFSDEAIWQVEEPALFAQSVALEGLDATVYDLLAPMVREVAAGSRSSTVFTVPVADVLDVTSWTADDLGVASLVDEADGEYVVNDEAAEAVLSLMTPNMDLVTQALISAYPYELYWFDKGSGVLFETPDIGITESGDEFAFVVEGSLAFSFSVSADYAADAYEVNASQVLRATKAVEKARDIVEQTSDLSVYERLVAFKNAICDLVTYDYEAADGATEGGGDPWQLVSVFDGDDSTNVVCEGYSKAFQYLCDLAKIEGVSCISATGVMAGGTGAGNHMWNIVNMDDGRNYLVDVTNCDEESVGYPDLLFIVAPTSGAVESSYVFVVDSDEVTYSYDEPCTSFFTTDDLTLSSETYAGKSDEEEPAELTEGWNQWGTCEWQIEDGTLTVRPLGNGRSGTLGDSSSEPWHNQRLEVTHAQFLSGVRAADTVPSLLWGMNNLVSVDFSGLDLTCAVSIRDIFWRCTSLERITVGEGFSFTGKGAERQFAFPSGDWVSVTSGAAYSASDVPQGAPDTYVRLDSDLWVPSEGWKAIGTCEWQVCDGTLVIRPLLNRLQGTLPALSWDSIPWHDEAASITSVEMRGQIHARGSLDFMFADLSSCRTMSLASFDTSSATSMCAMFRGCTSLVELDLSGFDTSQVTDMTVMFGSCESLKELNLSGIDTSKVTSFNGTFQDCSSLSTLDVTGFNTSSAKDMAFMFAGCTKLKNLDVSGFDTSEVSSSDAWSTGMSSMFLDCSSLVELDVSGFDTSKVTSMSDMFSGCSSLARLDVSGFDTRSVTSFCCMFLQCEQLTTIDVSGFDTSQATDLGGMFRDCAKVKVLDVAHFDTSKVTGFVEDGANYPISGLCCMFSGCRALTNVDVSRWDVSNVVDMRQVFAESGIQQADLRNWKPKSAKDMSWMFSECTSLKSLRLPSVSAPDLYDITRFCSGCTALVTADVKSWNVPKLKRMGYCFNGCRALKSLDLAGWKTQSLTELQYAFAECSSMTSIKVAGLDTKNVKVFDSVFMLNGVRKLDLRTWDMGKATRAQSMFDIDVTEISVGPKWKMVVGGSINFPDPFDYHSWWSTKDAAWYKVGYISKKRSGIADTYKKVLPLDSAAVTGLGERFYTGSQIKPKPTVTVFSHKLEQGVDYKLSYRNNTKVGTATVVITGIGCYSGQKLASFKIVAKTGAWKESSGKWWYRYVDGTYPKSQLADIDGGRYYFDGSGYMVTGWKRISGKWYYFESSGKMARGKWVKSGSNWCYTKSDGTMVTGWKTVSGKRYYFDANGCMVTGWKKIGGKWYYLESSGAMAKSKWAKSGNNWCYMKPDGTMATGWITLSGKKYYMNASGYMVTGWQKISGKYYYFEPSGAMVKSKWINNYYLKADGTMAVNEWIGNYHVDANGKWDKSK